MLALEGLTESSRAPYGVTLNEDYTALKQPATAATKALQALIYSVSKAEPSTANPYNSGEWDGTVTMKTVVALFNVIRYKAGTVINQLPALGPVFSLLTGTVAKIPLVGNLLNMPWAAGDLVNVVKSFSTDVANACGDLVVLVWNNAGNIQKPLELALALSGGAPPNSVPGSSTPIILKPMGGGGQLKTQIAVSKFYRFNKSRQVYVIYGKEGALGFGVLGDSGCIYGDCQNLGEAVDPPVPAGYIKLSEQATPPGGGLPNYGEESDVSVFGKWWFWALVAGGVAAAGTGGYYLLRKKRAATS
jgi:hypothetical protein